MKLEYIHRITIVVQSKIVNYIRVITAFLLAIKPENVRILAAIVLSVLLHAGVTILGDSQTGKAIDKIGLVSVKVAINSSHNAMQKSSKSPISHAIDASPITESVKTDSNALVTDKTTEVANPKSTTAEDQTIQPLTDKLADQITKKDIAKPDTIKQTNKPGEAPSASEQQLQKVTNKIDLVSVKVAINVTRNTDTTKPSSNPPMAQTTDAKPIKASVATKSKAVVADQISEIVSAESVTVDNQSEQPLTSKPDNQISKKNIAKPDTIKQTNKPGEAPNASEQQLQKATNKIDLVSVEVVINSTHNTDKPSPETPISETTNSDPVIKSLDTNAKSQAKNTIVERVSTQNYAVNDQSTQLLTIKPDQQKIKKDSAKVDTIAQTDKQGQMPTDSEQKSQKVTNKIDLVSAEVAINSTQNTAEPSPEPPMDQTANTNPISAQLDIDSQAPVKNKIVETISAQAAAISKQTSEQGLIKLHTPVVSAIPLYHMIQKPPYPVRSRDLGEEGTVTIAIKVAADGSVIEAYISKTSGYTLLDGSALSTVTSQWRFKPARRAGNPVDAWVKVPIKFNIKKQ
ncbi:MAG TPA: energy transducer TonB [Gammaproteobacteria bacterium]|nr:energy transducer TonB [Gammaproteobacteria bacterium]